MSGANTIVDIKYLANKAKYSCTNPIKFKQNNREYVCSCGKCPGCISLRRNNQISSIRDYASKFKYSYFTLLTYNQAHVPIYRRIVDSNDFVINPVTQEKEYNCQFIRTYPSFVRGYRDIYTVDNSVAVRYDYSDSFTLYQSDSEFLIGSRRQSHRIYEDSLFLPSVRDVQLFLKRLRKSISTYAKKHNYPDGLPQQCSRTATLQERISSNPYYLGYYLVSEYGGSDKQESGGFRPHYHIIFCFNSDFIANHICGLVRLCWRLGMSNTQLSAGHAAEYVADYVSDVSSLPRLFSRPNIRPFRLHSIGVRKEVIGSPRDISELQRFTSLALNGITLPIDNRYVTVYPSGSYLVKLFVRPKVFYTENSLRFNGLYQQIYDGIDRLHRQACEGIEPLFPLFDPLSSIKDLAYLIFYKSITTDSQDLDIFREYFDLRPLKNMYYDSNLLQQSFLSFSDTQSCVSALARIYAFLSALRHSCLLWKIRCRRDFGIYISACYSFYVQLQKKRLSDFYADIERVNDPSYASYKYAVTFSEFFSDINLPESKKFLIFARNAALGNIQEHQKHKNIKHSLL